MKISQAKIGQVVVYNKSFGDEESGQVSSWNKTYIFVKFENQLNNLGWDDVTSQACNPHDLTLNMNYN